ncbi:prepilin peptidase [Jannaschia aquimarina]|uniref:Type IV leader peptidase family protein n=1 Tax=Jannaschia aquimarina TaxID=935700 RepID=A0A0D1CP33_9RHOB|nr:prepilin peptidase [Jannaschia aquimarina]KIT16527.1 Type IV leader peptidase family protein [Jannaschia aquimarina]SNT06445.1 prepilin peptidase CpaA [Jannaschia aquimarina]
MEFNPVTLPLQGLVFGLLSLPVCLWIIWTDLREMKIKNAAVLALLAIFAVAGFFLLPLDEYLWRYAHFAVVLVIGFLMHVGTGLGAGDAKLAAAMAPFVPLSDATMVGLLYIAWVLSLLVAMTIARRLPALRTAAPGWIWLEEGRGHIPLGVGLAPTLSSYFFIAAAGGI